MDKKSISINEIKEEFELKYKPINSIQDIIESSNNKQYKSLLEKCQATQLNRFRR